MAGNNKAELKAQFVAATKISDDGKTITNGSVTATKLESGKLARLFGISSWEIKSQAEANGSLINYSQTQTGWNSPAKIINKAADVAVWKAGLLDL